MEIVYSSSDSYAVCTGVSIYSLYEHNKNVSNLNVHILSTDISDVNKNRLKEIADYFNRPIDIIDAKQDFIEEANRLELSLLRGAYNTYSRIVLNRWFNYLDKIMVIDSDTLVTGSLVDAWNIDVSEYIVAAVPEIAMYTKHIRFEDPELVKNLDIYFNMGICIVNLKQWREKNIDDLLFTSIKKDHPVFKIADQSIINKYLANKIARLPLKFNYYSPIHNISYKTACNIFSRRLVFEKQEFNEASENPSIIHYFGHSYERPWFKYSIAIRKKEYLSTRDKTPWGNLPLERWRKNSNKALYVYDVICFLLLKLHLYSFSLKFRYIGGQAIKSWIKISR
jgi:lipopolysaccharide biosynthesis glycosyltransferase